MIIPPHWTLPDSIRSRLGQNTYGRQRALIEEKHLLLVLHQPPGPDDEQRQGVLFWRTPNGEWQASRGGGGAGALKRHVQSYAELETKLVHDFEKGPGLSELFDLLDALTPLSRAARNMHAALQHAREAIQGDTQLIEFRDLAYDVERNFELLIEDVRLAIQLRTAKEEEEQARLGQEALRASHRLNTLAALFLPMTALASLFGMNLKHGLDENSVPMFLLVLGIGVALGFAVKGWVVGGDKMKPSSEKKPS
jgi:hypothetical protein